MEKSSVKSRRQLLRTVCGGAAVGIWALPKASRQWLVKTAHATVLTRAYPAKRLRPVSEIEVGEVWSFTYPDEGHEGILIRLDHEVEGLERGDLPGDAPEWSTAGVGPGRDIVAFSTRCPHMGCKLEHNAEHARLIGPCRCHHSVFDITRGGAQLQGQATQGLPQVLLEVAGGALFAVGVQGLLFGRNDNLAG